MKKLIAILCALLLAASLTAAMAEDAGIGGIAGGWAAAADPTVTDDVKALLDKALAELVGVDYVPVAYLGSQVVAGTNHAILCQATVVVPDAEPFYAIVYLYEDLQGNVSVLDIEEFDFGALCNYGAEE